MVGLLLLGTAFGCGSDSDDEDVDATSTETPTATDESTGGEEDSGGQSSGGQSGDGSSGGGGQTSPPPAPTGPPPTIVSFETPENIDCHNSNFQEFTASWTTTNATEVVISIDGPGPYGAYPPNSATSLPFNCSSSHTFTLTARSQDGQEVSTSVTLEPRNVQPPQNGENGETEVTPTEEPDTVPTETPTP